MKWELNRHRKKRQNTKLEEIDWNLLNNTQANINIRNADDVWGIQ